MMVLELKAESLAESETHVETAAADSGVACGKIILSGEHAVVYGKHALAVPIRLAVRSHVRRRADSRTFVGIPAWGIPAMTAMKQAPGPVRACVDVICGRLGLNNRGFELLANPQIARGSGLGGSAAMAVATIRAFLTAFELELPLEAVNELAFECEKIAHGTPSGVDNTVATYARPLLFRKNPPLMTPLKLGLPLRMVVGLSGEPGMTVHMVQQVRASREAEPQRINAILDAIDRVTLLIKASLESGEVERIGPLMTENHGLLQSLGVSSRTLDTLVDLARSAGALGAKLTGGGGGGAMVALCQERADAVAGSMRKAGFTATTITVE